MPNWLFDPLWEGPSRAGRNIANRIDPPAGEGGRLRGFLAGSMEGAGDVLSDMTSPLSIASLLTGTSGARRLVRGARSLSPYADDAANLAEAYDRMGPEFVPIGGENISNALRGSRQLGELDKIRQIAEESERGVRAVRNRALPIGGQNFDFASMMARRKQ